MLLVGVRACKQPRGPVFRSRTFGRTGREQASTSGKILLQPAIPAAATLHVVDSRELSARHRAGLTTMSFGGVLMPGDALDHIRRPHLRSREGRRRFQWQH